VLSAEEIYDRITLCESAELGMLSVVPKPDLAAIRNDGAASIDLRLGRWFRTLRPSRTPLLDIAIGLTPDVSQQDAHLTKEHFVRFGEPFVLHPHNFVLGITLEWIRMPRDLGGYIVGKSSLARRGLIIETAAGVQPGFSGCLALELSNVGEVPLALVPGMRVCQIFLHRVLEGRPATSQFSGRRKPVLGNVQADDVLRKLKHGN
jgi:dCTP deaminase